MNTTMKLAVLAAITAFAASQASANLVLNGSFEDPVAPFPPGYNGGPITDWTIVGNAGIWNPSTYPPTAPLVAPDGVQVGYENSGSISQNLGTVHPNTVYNLSIEVGGRSDGFVPGTDY